MSTVTEPESDIGRRLLGDYELPLPRIWKRRPQALRTAIFLILLTALSAYVRTRFLTSGFWMDEAISVGIASHPLSQIPHVLRFDGSPPLYYLLLHVWMGWFGDSEAATHCLSLVFGLATIPISFWGVMTLWHNRRMANVVAFLFAFNAFLTGYSQETRMYALMGLLGLLATIGYLAGFVQRRRRFLPLFTVAQALMLYTHAWGVFFGAAGVIGLIILYRIGGEEVRKNLISDGLKAYIAAGILFVPWIPNFIFQSLHTAAPWDSAPRFGAPLQLSRGLMGGISITAVLLLCCGLGLYDLFQRRNRKTPDARMLWLVIALPFFTLLLAWLGSQLTPAWSVRYFSPVLGAVLFLFALGIARAGLAGAITVVLVLAMFHNPAGFAPQYKSDMKDVAGELGGSLHQGDLVIVGQPEQTPLAHYYLPSGLRFTNTIGPVSDPTYFNWVDALKKYKAADPQKILPPLLNSLKTGQQILFIRPMTEGAQNWKASWTELIRLRSAQWGAIIAADKHLVREPGRWAPHNYFGACCVADSAVLYKKV
ncbi:MAG: glycosyltransferase family 39 protein [Solirubrobacterales bacterium]|nr:glycosyltransferase family 39 protein [Solirubrobacterales bacterium]